MESRIDPYRLKQGIQAGFHSRQCAEMLTKWYQLITALQLLGGDRRHPMPLACDDIHMPLD